MVRLLAEQYDTKSNVKLGRFRSQFQASNVCSHAVDCDTMKQPVCGWLYIFLEREREREGEREIISTKR